MQDRPRPGALKKRDGGKYEQDLGADWAAEYFQDAATGLWRAEVFHHDVPVWVSTAHATLEDAVQAVSARL